MMVPPPDSSPPIIASHIGANKTVRTFTIQWQKGLLWALLSPLFMGATPILAKLAYAAGAEVFTVVALRTTFAALVLWVAVAILDRRLIRSSAPAVAGSIVAGAINGVGSIFYYGSLMLIGASLGQLINISYLVFVTLLLRLAGHNVSLLTVGRVVLVIGAIYLLTLGGLGPPNWIGVGMMVAGAFSYAVQLVMSQRILYDIPAPTMTLYAISAMAVTVNLAWLIVRPDLAAIRTAGWEAILLMGLLTSLSRLTLFLGVKHLGSLQTALIGVFEVIVSVALAIVFLGEHLTGIQWLGGLILLASILLVRFEKGVPRFVDMWPLLWRIMTRFRLMGS
jgi:drug/metabolite transporter (DMT)-like permease